MEESKGFFWEDYLMAGGVAVIGLAEAAHLTAVFLGRSFSDCAALFFLLAAGAAGAAAVSALLAGGRRARKKGAARAGVSRKSPWDAREELWSVILYGGFFLLALSQLVFVLGSGGEYRQSDMTVETVQSFLETDGVYAVNPMTGRPYTGGIPSRLKILCLPTLYACVCRLTGLEASFAVRRLIPAAALLFCYAAYGALARCLFPGDRRRRGCFLAATALLLWVGSYRFGMDGFGVLFGGYRGVVIRNCALVPWLLSLCLRKKWAAALLCVLAEACVVWTLYGLGVCAAVTAGMAAAWAVLDRRRARREAA